MITPRSRSHTLQAAAGRLSLLAAVLLTAAVHAQAPCSLVAAYERVPLLDDGSGDLDLYLQKLSPEGVPQWGVEGVVVSNTQKAECRPALVADGQGGALVLFEVRTFTGDGAGRSDLFAQRVDGRGHALWNGGAPIPLATTEYDESSVCAAADGAGGAIAAFVVAIRDEKRALSGVCAQRIGPEGGLQWGAGSHAVVVEEAAGVCDDLQAVGDGAGGLVVAYQWRPADAGADTASELHCARIAPDGSLLWRARRGGAESPRLPSPRSPRLAADSTRGVWVAYLYGASSRPGLAVERILADGSVGAGPVVILPPNGKIVWDALCACPSVVADGCGGLLCTYGWRTAEGVRKLGVCRLSSDGRVLRGAPELSSAIGPGLSTFSAAALTALAGGAATLVAASPVPGRSFAHALLARRIAPDGLEAGGVCPQVVTGADGRIRRIRVLPDGAQGAYVLYRFDASGRGGGLFALRMSPEGQTLWPVPVALLAAPWAGAHFACCEG